MLVKTLYDVEEFDSLSYQCHSCFCICASKCILVVETATARLQYFGAEMVVGGMALHLGEAGAELRKMPRRKAMALIPPNNRDFTSVIPIAKLCREDVCVDLTRFRSQVDRNEQKRCSFNRDECKFWLRLLGGRDHRPA